MPGPGQDGDQHLDAGQEVQSGGGLAGDREQVAVLGEQFQAARLVAGQRAELDVPADGAQHRGLAAREAVAGQVAGAGLVRPALAQQRQQGDGLAVVGLQLAGAAAAQHRGQYFQGAGVVAEVEVVPGTGAGLTGVAVAQLGARAGRPQLVGVLDTGAGEAGQVVALGVVRLQAEAGGAVAVAQFGVPAFDGRQRHVRVLP